MDWNSINIDRDTSGLGPIEYDQSKVPALIRKHADNVRIKTYGQQIREAQARNAEYAGLIASESFDMSNETKERQDTVETQFNSVQQEMTDKDVISAPEIIAARKGEPTLSTRLEKFDRISVDIFSESDLDNLPTDKLVTANIGKVVDVLNNRTLSDNITLKFNHDGLLNVQPTVTLKVNGKIESERKEVFRFSDSTSKVETEDIGKLGQYLGGTKMHQEIYPEWFGAKGDAYVDTSLTSLPIGTDDTEAFKRMMEFAGKASVNGTTEKLKTPKVKISLAPNAIYLVKGDNILGVQDESVEAVSIDIEGNGAQILHVVNSSNDYLINNAYKMLFPKFKDFSVDVFTSQSYDRMGGFFNNNGTGKPVVKMFKPIFENVRVSSTFDYVGYETIFNVDGDTMADNGLVISGYYSTFKYFYNQTNPEAVSWDFDNNYIHPTTAGAVIYNVDCVTSGALSSNSNEILIANDNTKYLKTSGNSQGVGVFEIKDRLELFGNVSTTLFDLDYGLVKVSGINFHAGNRGYTTPATFRMARIGNLASIEFVDGNLVSKDFDIGPLDQNFEGYQPRNLLTLKNTSVASGGVPLIRPYNAIGVVNVKNLLQGVYRLRKVSVENHNGRPTMPFDYSSEGGISTSQKVTLSKNINAKSSIHMLEARLPFYFVVESIKVFSKFGFKTDKINQLKLQILNPSSNYEYPQSTTKDISTLNGVLNGFELLDGQKMIVGFTELKLGFVFQSSGVKIADVDAPDSWVEITYRGVGHFQDAIWDDTLGFTRA